MLGLYPIVTLGAVGGISVFLVVLACVRIMSVASMAGAAMLPIATLAALLFMKNHGDASITRSHAALLAACALLAMLVVWTHRANISRLRAGTEPRLAKKPPIVR
jgi:glycerol-3-phosphate acyltransferase PlsY